MHGIIQGQVLDYLCNLLLSPGVQSKSIAVDYKLPLAQERIPIIKADYQANAV